MRDIFLCIICISVYVGHWLRTGWNGSVFLCRLLKILTSTNRVTFLIWFHYSKIEFIVGTTWLLQSLVIWCFANDVDNANIVNLYKEALSSEQNAEVRKMLVLSLAPSNDTTFDIIEWTLDVNDSVRTAAYRVLADKFPLQSLSIKLRTTILQRNWQNSWGRAHPHAQAIRWWHNAKSRFDNPVICRQQKL